MQSHEYEKQWSAGGDYAPLVMPAGTQSLCFALPYMHAAMITKLVVKQVDGTPTPFSVNLYNRQTCDVYPSSSSSSAPASSISPEVCKVIPTQRQGVPGLAMELFHPDGYSFRNMEGSLSVPVRQIYIELILDEHAADSVWEVALGCRPKY